jgi:hypothetical protein
VDAPLLEGQLEDTVVEVVSARRFTTTAISSSVSRTAKAKS